MTSSLSSCDPPAMESRMSAQQYSYLIIQLVFHETTLKFNFPANTDPVKYNRANFVKLILMKKLQTITQSNENIDKIKRKYKQNKEKLNRHCNKSNNYPSFIPNHQVEHSNQKRQLKNVIKEVKHLKQQIIQIKRSASKSSYASGLDMSVCKHLASITKNKSDKSSSFPSASKHALSISKSRMSNSSQKTKSLPKEKIIPKKLSKEFSFSINEHNEPIAKKQQPIHSESEQEEQESTKRNKRAQHQNLKQQIKSIQQKQQYLKYASKLNHLQIVEFICKSLSIDKSLKINVVLNRLSKKIKQMPFHCVEADQYYKNAEIYIFSIANELNACVNLINNSLQKKQISLSESVLQQKQHNCQNCLSSKQNQVERRHRKEMKRLNKQISDLQYELALKTRIQQGNNDSYDKISKEYELIHLENQELLKNNKILHQQINQLQFKKQEANTEIERRNQQIHILHEDIRLLHIDLDRMRKSKAKEMEDEVGNLRKIHEAQLNELKEDFQKQKQDMLGEVDELKRMHGLILSRSRQSLPEEEEQYSAQIDELRQLAHALSQQNAELKTTIDLCMEEINKLHAEIDEQQIIIERYKDKYMKSKAAGQDKQAREKEYRGRKEAALKQIKQIIEMHKKDDA